MCTRGGGGRVLVRGAVPAVKERGGNVAGGDAWTWEQVNVGEQVQMEDFQFNENEGLKVRINENPQPIDFVEIYFTETLLQLIVTETNRYPKKYVEANSKKADSSYIVRWAPVACSEMKVFLGLLLLTGIIQKGSLNTYWSTEELIQTPMFSIVMTSDRFLLIL